MKFSFDRIERALRFNIPCNSILGVPAPGSGPGLAVL